MHLICFLWSRRGLCSRSMISAYAILSLVVGTLRKVCACSDFTVSAVTWSVSSAKVLLSIIVVAMQNQLEPSARYAWSSHCCSSCCSCTEGRGCLGNGQEPFAPGETHPSAFSDDHVIDQISDTRSQGCTDLQSLIMCLGLWCYSMQVLRQYTAVPATAHDAFACAGCVLR